MTDARPMRVLLVDPSLFSAPYDAALTEGLLSAGVEPTWAVRPTRPGDRQEIANEHVDALFYRHVERLTRLPRLVRAVVKGISHALGLVQLIRHVMTRDLDVVHFQWVVVPALDALALLVLRRRCPVVLTVHDTVPYNGERLSFFQNFAFDFPIRLCDRVIVHTQAGREALVRRGIAGSKIAVIAHGPLHLPAVAPGVAIASRTDPRWTFVLFGEIKRYKGVDVFIEAIGLLPRSLRDAARFVVAGRPRMDLSPIAARIAELDLGGAVEILAKRLSEQEMADLFAQSDCFVFPYRQVDASGVYFLVKSGHQWIIASRVGVFAEDIQEGVHGALVPPGDARALADAMTLAIVERFTPQPRSPSSEWTTIGRATRDVYAQSRMSRAAGAPPGNTVKMDALVPEPLSERGLHRGDRQDDVAPTISRRAIVRAAPAAIAIASLPGWVSAQTAAPPAPLGFSPQSSYRLVKNWDFANLIRDAAALGAEFHTRYIYQGGTLDHLGDEWGRYRDNGNHVFTPTGLSLVARVLGALAPGNVQSGMLRSRWTGQLGVFEIRMRVPRARGTWPAFWLNPEDQRWPPEIDVVEIVNNERDTTKSSFHFLHGPSVKSADDVGTKLGANHAYVPGFDYAEAFHVFSAEWTPERVRHFVDGSLIADRPYRWTHDDGTEGGPAHVLVNLAVGGGWPGPPTSEAAFPASLDVEYVRVWQR